MLVKENGDRDRRFRIEHSQHISDNDFQRFKDMSVIASVQPVHLKYDASTVREKLSDDLVYCLVTPRKLSNRITLTALGGLIISSSKIQ